MQVKAQLNYLRIAPRKLRLVADLIRGKSVEEAQAILSFTIKKGAWPLLKLLKSAIASAKNNFQLQESNLFISKISIDEGPKLKRWRARARGTANEIQKKTSHINLVLEESAEKVKKVVKKVEEVKETEKTEKVEEKTPKTEKPKFKPKIEVPRPKTEKGLKKMFRRKVF